MTTASDEDCFCFAAVLIFSDFGNVLDVYLLKHKSGKVKSFGFTEFEGPSKESHSKEGLNQALEVSDEEFLPGSTAPCFCKCDTMVLHTNNSWHVPLQAQQVAEHDVEGVKVKINKADPRPEHEHMIMNEKTIPQQARILQSTERVSCMPELLLLKCFFLLRTSACL